MFTEGTGLILGISLGIAATSTVVVVVWTVVTKINAQRIRKEMPEEQMADLRRWWSCLDAAPDSVFELVGRDAVSRRTHIETLAENRYGDQDSAIASLSGAGLLDSRRYAGLEALADSPTDDEARRTWLSIRPDIVDDYTALSEAITALLDIADARTSGIGDAANAVAGFVWRGLSDEAKEWVSGSTDVRWRADVEAAVGYLDPATQTMSDIDERRINALEGIREIYQAMRTARESIEDAAASSIQGSAVAKNRWSLDAIAHRENRRRELDRQSYRY